MILIDEAQLISSSTILKKKNKQSLEKERTPSFTGDLIIYIKKKQNAGFFKKKLRRTFIEACYKINTLKSAQFPPELGIRT